MWSFSGGRLVSASTKYPSSDTAQQIEWLTAKYGPATKTDTVTYQTGFGARWDCARVYWMMPDGTAIVAQEMILNLNRSLLVSFASQSVMAMHPAGPNPYDAK